VGKTRLLAQWLEAHVEDGFYWVAEPASPLSQLRSFSQALMSFMDPEIDIPPDFSFASWELALPGHCRCVSFAGTVRAASCFADTYPRYDTRSRKSGDDFEDIGGGWRGDCYSLARLR
jgi:hypothetical protein